MYRVELKEKLRKDFELLSGPFLMYRVELKVSDGDKLIATLFRGS